MEDKAATQCLELAKLYEAQGDKASASDLLSEAYDLNPALNKGASSPGRGANGQPVKKLADSIEIDLSASLDSDFGAEPAKPQSTTYQPQASAPSGFDLFNSKPSSAPPASNLPPTSSLSYGLPDLFGQPSAQASAGPSKASPPLSGFDLFNQGQSSSQSAPQPPQTPAGQFGLPNFFGQTVPDQPAFQPAKPSTQAPSSLGDIFNASSQSPLANVPSVPIGAKGETTGVPSTSFEIDVDDTSTSSQIAKDKILKDELDGVDFYIAQGYMEIARGALEDLEKQHPNHPAILQRFAQMGITKPSTNMLKTSSDMEAVEELPDSAILESSPASVPAPTTPFNPFGGFPSPGKALQSPPLATPQKQTPPPQPPAPAPMPDVLASRVQPTAASQASGGSLFDSLISDVEAELDEMPTHDMMPMAKTVASSPATSSSKPVSSLSDQSDLGSIFTEFQQEFETSDKPDFETHYNLGLAYKDMELFDDAIEQFQLAFKATSPTSGDGNYFNCCNMLGFCFLKNNMARPSAVWYKRGLEAPNRSDEEYQAMRFDLAGAHEQLKEYKKALECLQEVYALDINYRDVGSKIREIEEKLNQEG
jgi:tetratricopeptide (TPR) repeat protein